MSWQVLVALVTISLTWSWPLVAGLLSLAFGGFLRIGEALSATRAGESCGPTQGRPCAPFKQLCQAFALQASPGGGRPFLELASLRAGGASEDSEMLRRRGRWLSTRIMEIYVQEVASLEFLPVQSDQSKLCIYTALQSFHSVVEQATVFDQLRVPARHWYFLFASGTRA